MIYLLIIILIQIIIFYLINKILKHHTIEKYTGIISEPFYKELGDNSNYTINKESRTLTYCKDSKCITKSYNKHFNN